MAGRPKKKPEYNPELQFNNFLQELKDAYEEADSLRSLADELNISLLKLRKLLITADVFKTATGLPFQYKLKVGKNGEYNRELLINRREKSKSLAWSSVVLAFENSKRISEEVKKPKALGDIRGVSYIYPILWRFGLIRVPEAIEKKMGKQR